MTVQYGTETISYVKKQEIIDEGLEIVCRKESSQIICSAQNIIAGSDIDGKERHRELSAKRYAESCLSVESRWTVSLHIQVSAFIYHQVCRCSDTEISVQSVERVKAYSSCRKRFVQDGYM